QRLIKISNGIYPLCSVEKRTFCEREINIFKSKSLLMIMYPSCNMNWPLWKRILFRFFFIFFFLYLTPWTWLDSIPKVDKLTSWYYDLEDWVVRLTNYKILHIKKELVPVSGSGDTSWWWAQLYTFLLFALVGCLIWSVIDWKRKSYNKADYWLCLFTRYYVAIYAFVYGI